MSASKSTFKNPLLNYGPDPWAMYQDGFYYYTHSTHDSLTIWKTADITKLEQAEQKVVWKAPGKGPFSKNVWAPELNYLNDGQGNKCWYAYLSAGDEGNASDQRIWVLVNNNPDPLKGDWQVQGELKTPNDKWSIDGTVIDVDGQLYLAWSGWEANDNSGQNIYFCRMSNPWTCVGERLLLSAPTLPWERHFQDSNPDNPRKEVYINEAPASFRHGSHLFVAYSASACWTDDYAMGLLTVRLDSDLMQADSWEKAPNPVFKTSVRNSVYGPGHGCFFQTVNGQNWLLYHANPGSDKGCENERTPRLQRIRWHRNGMPNFGVPAAEKTTIEKPA